MFLFKLIAGVIFVLSGMTLIKDGIADDRTTSKNEYKTVYYNYNDDKFHIVQFYSVDELSEEDPVLER